MIQTLWPEKGLRVRAVGSGVYMRAAAEAFINFLWELVKFTFGKEWWLAECAKPHEERHQAVKWWYDLSEWGKENWSTAERYGYMRKSKASGAVLSLSTFGYDLYTMQHACAFPEDLRERLRDRHEFQGARYELAVAALCSRAGFKVEWLSANERGTHCEFIASDNTVRFGVEAKSRRRRGVLHEAGTLDEAKVVRGDVQGLFEKASTQAPEGLPFVIFIDLNCPPTPEAAMNPSRASWWTDLSEMLATYGEIMSGKDDQNASPTFNALAITNFSTHYFGQDEAETTGERLLIRTVRPRHALPDDVLMKLWTGVSRYGSIPMDPD